MTRAEKKDKVFMNIALELADLSTCRRRKVGCVLVDDQFKIIATGFNGVPRGWDHCTDVPCPGVGMSPGTGLDVCYSLHAEHNALLQCKEPDYIWTAYCTTSPCMHCLKMLANTGCRRILFREPYVDQEPGRLWGLQEKAWVQSV